jgi:hypothetical protein
MSSLVTTSTEKAINSGTLESLSTTFGLMAVVLGVILLVERELIRALGGAYARERVRAFLIVGLPAVLIGILVIVTRLASLR